MSNKKKNDTLGMPHGTATGRLRKLVLFRQLEKHKENVCVRCGKTIETADELSTEHIKPWEGISAELFWDLNNIAFSHLSCNKPHSYPRAKIEPTSGTNWCYRCKEFKDIKFFGKCSFRRTGLENRCRDCKNYQNSLRER